MGGYGDGYPPPGEYRHPPPHGEYPPPPPPPVYGSSSHSPYGAPYPPIPARERAFEVYPPPHAAFPAVPFAEHHGHPHAAFPAVPFEEHHGHPHAAFPAVPFEEHHGHHEFPHPHAAYPAEEHHRFPHHGHPQHEENSGTFHDRSRLPPGQLVRLHCQANTDFNLAVRYDGIVLLPANAHDESQQWIKDMSWGTKVKDEKGFPAFALINKATGKALQHPGEELQQVLLTDYNPTGLNESVLWTESEDMGKGYKTIRMANNIKLNLDAFRGDKKSGGVKEGTPAVLFRWKKQENQLWKIVPV